MDCVLGGVNIEKELSFKCVPERLVCNYEDYKVYGCFVNSFKYPDVKISKYGTATIIGDIQELCLGVEYTVIGIETDDKRGVSYKVKNIKRDKPNSLAQIRNFLYEVLTEQQTNILLEVYPDIVDRIINDKLDDIDLSKTKGIKEYTFNVIKKKVIENFKLSDLVNEFQGLFSISTLKKLYEKYPSIEKLKQKIREEPYECLCKLSGIGFKKADAMLLAIDKSSKKSIAKGETPILFFGFDLLTSYQRMKSCVDYILDENENNGNTYVHVGELKKQCEILCIEAKEHLPVILKADNDVWFNRESLSVAKKTTYTIELFVAVKLLAGNNIKTAWDCDCSKYIHLDNFHLTDKQQQTTQLVCENNIVILNGFGGSGKSSSVKALINMLKDYNKTFQLFAPTGRAAKVLSAYTSQDAKTIHRGLGFMPPSTWSYNSEFPLPYDIVIVDEFSMVDIFLFKRLLEAIDFTKTKLLVIGDDAQLPSVGAGNVLFDLLQSGIFPTITLDKIFRYGEGGLSTAATDTRCGKEYLEKAKTGMQVLGTDKSYVFMPLVQEKIVDYTVALYKKLLEQGLKQEDIAILSAYNVGDYGTLEINKRIQNAVNKNASAVINYGESEFRLNDIVMNVVNDYKAIKYNEEYLNDEDTTFIANGEIGKVVKVLHNAMVVDYDGLTIYCPKGNLNNIRLAYAISTHKSQGGQFNIVILLTPRAHTFTLNSNLLYVGESRAKEKCYHLGEIKTINSALKKRENFDRKTMLQKFLKGELKEINE